MKQINALLTSLRDIMSTRIVRIGIILLFIIQASALVFIMPFGTPPDENNNIQFISFYAENSPGPIFSEQQPTWNLGDKTREVDYLYHYVMSWVVRVSPFSHDAELHIIRLLSIICGVAALLIFIRVWKALGIKDGAINTGLIIFTNLPMVLMLSAAINNDVFVWLALALTSWLVIKVIKEPRLIDIVLLANVVIFGGLVKRTFLPVAFIIGIYLLYIIVLYWRQLRRQFMTPDWKVIISIAALLAGTGLFVERIGGNIIQYGTVDPGCDMVQGEEACQSYWSNVRRSQLAAQPPQPNVPLPRFVGSWTHQSFNNIADIQTQSWQHRVTPPIWYTPTLMLLFIGSLTYGVIHDRKKARRDMVARWRLGAVALGVYIFLVQLIVNYSIYLDYNVFGIALNGRYVLPAVLLLTPLSCYYLTQLLKLRYATIVGWVVVLITIAFTGLIMMLRNPQLFGA